MSCRSLGKRLWKRRANRDGWICRRASGVDNEIMIKMMTMKTFTKITTIGTLRCDDSNGNETVKKNNRFNEQNKNSARASRFFVHFICRHCTTTTWKCLTAHFMEDVNWWQATTKFSCSLWTCMWFLRIQLRQSSLTFGKEGTLL